jgi:hypothetical protein
VHEKVYWDRRSDRSRGNGEGASSSCRLIAPVFSRPVRLLGRAPRLLKRTQSRYGRF